MPRVRSHPFPVERQLRGLADFSSHPTLPAPCTRGGRNACATGGNFWGGPLRERSGLGRGLGGWRSGLGAEETHGEDRDHDGQREPGVFASLCQDALSHRVHGARKRERRRGLGWRGGRGHGAERPWRALPGGGGGACQEASEAWAPGLGVLSHSLGDALVLTLCTRRGS